MLEHFLDCYGAFRFAPWILIDHRSQNRFNLASLSWKFSSPPNPFSVLTWTNIRRGLIKQTRSKNKRFACFFPPSQMANQNGKSVVVRILTEPQQESNETETSPLNQRGRDNNSDASSAASAVNSEQSTKKLIEDDMSESRQNLAKIGFDFLLLCCGEFDWKLVGGFWARCWK